MKTIFSPAVLALSCLSALAQTNTAEVQDEPKWQVQTSLVTVHYHYDPRHNDNQQMLDISRRFEANYLLGFTSFKNSFGQQSEYLYGGKIFRPLDDWPDAYIKLSAGLLAGYKGAYKNKIPFNNYGAAPVVIPSFGYEYKRVTLELLLLGNAGLLTAVGYRF